MEFAPSSPTISSSPRPSSPAHTNSSSATRVETTSFDFFLKQTNNSPCLMTSEIGSDYSGSPKIPLSPVDEVPNSPAVREGLLYSLSRRGKCGLTSPSHRGKPGYLHSAKELPRSPSPRGMCRISSPPHRPSSPIGHLTPASPMRLCNSTPRLSSPPVSPLLGKLTSASPLELRISAHTSGQEYRSEFTAKDIAEHEELIMKGLAEMNLSTLYKLFKARLSGRKAARQHLAVTTWKVQEAKDYLEFSQALNEDNKMHLRNSDEELRRVRVAFTGHSHSEIEDDRNYLQAVYDDECNILRAIAAQADIMGKVLGLSAKSDLLSSRGESSHHPHFTSSVYRNGSRTSSEDGDDGNDTMDSDDDEEAESHNA
ncbi:hypothetical protein DEU56DRAFT_909165 [Suillus clintonianus]|uniref:uncharacterized protein n=1 Tax=Suillus clintonianus TaxID=1904413 RepID=UPI001B87AD71|nr:uncharacterized protein DEU56DRAFT_909165 [Suillus clintonianus]KAG2148851.1 hypothetical protein DEU56DRAFT_909165 [Suillus clintonianus]